METPAVAPQSNSSTIILIAGFVLVLTISTLVLENPEARLVAAGLAALGLAAAVAMIVVGKMPTGGRHIASTPAPARHRRTFVSIEVDGPTERLPRRTRI